MSTIASFGPAYASASVSYHDIGWSGEIWTLLSLAIAMAWYVRGYVRICHRDRLHRVIGGRELGAFAAGMFVLVIALLPPLASLGERLFSMHMVQHLLLLMLAPPLFVASRPAIAGVWAFAPATRRWIGRIWAGAGLSRAVEWLMNPVLVWCLFSGSFVLWHMPGPYQRALSNEGAHVLEHLSFFLSALMFWTIVIEPSGHRRIGYGATLLFVATTAFLSSLPGALIFLAPHPLYPIHAGGAAEWGLTLIEDQQLAGVIMWIPGGLIYLAGALWVFMRWMQEAEERPPQRPSHRGLLVAMMTAVALPMAGMGHVALAQTRTGLQDAPGIVGDAERGASLIRDYGCGACHIVPGIEGADGLVGPPLIMIGRRIYLAGLLRNTPENMMTWLQNPQRIVPGNAMPNMGITPQAARDITAYLYTLR